MKVNREKLIDLINKGKLQSFRVYNVSNIYGVGKKAISFEYERLSYDLFPDRENFQLSTFIFQEEIEKAKEGFLELDIILLKYGLCKDYYEKN